MAMGAHPENKMKEQVYCMIVTSYAFLRVPHKQSYNLLAYQEDVSNLCSVIGLGVPRCWQTRDNDASLMRIPNLSPGCPYDSDTVLLLRLLQS